MCNRTTVAKAFATAASALAIALFTIGIGINSAWAGSDPPRRLKFTPISIDLVVQPVLARPGHLHLSFAKPWPAESALVTSRQSQPSAEPIIAETTQPSPDPSTQPSPAPSTQPTPPNAAGPSGPTTGGPMSR